MHVIIPPETNTDGLNEKLKSIGLGFMIKKEEVFLVYREKHPEVFGHSDVWPNRTAETRDTQDLSP